MNEQPKYTWSQVAATTSLSAEKWAELGPEMQGLLEAEFNQPVPMGFTAPLILDSMGFAPMKAEGAPAGYPPRPVKPKPWLVRQTEWPRRKVARALVRLANYVCRDRDEGW